MAAIDDLVRENRETNDDGVLSQNTLRTYRFYWGEFEDFCEEFAIPALPAQGDHVGAFLHRMSTKVSNRTGQPYSVAAIRVARQAIRWMHSEARVNIPTDHKDVQDVIARLKNERPDNPTQAAPLTDEIVADIRATACNVRQHPTRKESWATAQTRGRKEIGLVAFLAYVGSRIGETASLKWGQIFTAEDGRGTVTFLQRQTKSRRMRTVGIPRHVMVDLERIRCGADDGDPVFWNRKGRHCTPKTLQRWMRNAIKATGRDPSPFSGHSGRVQSAQRHILTDINPALTDLSHGWQGSGMAAYYGRHISALKVLDELGET